MRRYVDALSRPGLAACALVTLLVVGCVGPGESELLEISDPAVRPPAAAGSAPSVTVATVDPVEPAASTPASTGAPSGEGPVATVTASRLVDRGPQVAVGRPPIPPVTSVPVGLMGLPFAPAGLDGCDEMAWYREQWSLPAHFDRVGFRESSCRNWVTSPTGCCSGWWQIHEVHVGERHLEHCGIYTVADMRGHDPIVKQRQACAALAIYRVQGPDAWSQTW